MIPFMKAYTSHSLDETRAIAAEWLKLISEKYAGHDEALIVGLSGHLGAGKTAFVKAVAKELGVAEEVTSPTFVLMKIYGIDQAKSGSSEGTVKGPWCRLVHIDAYRLEKREELEALRFEELVADKANLILIEWPENAGLKDFEPLAKLDLEIKDGHHSIKVQ